MTPINHGVFDVYSRAPVDGTAFAGMYFRNAEGVDFYELRDTLPAGRAIVAVGESGRVVCAGAPPLDPRNAGAILYEIECEGDAAQLVGQILDLDTGAISAPPPPVPASVSDRQFAQALAERGEITWAEAQAWGARGEIPAAVLASLSGLPQIERDRAVMILGSVTSFERSHPLVASIAQSMGWDEAAVDDLWRFAATL